MAHPRKHSLTANLIALLTVFTAVIVCAVAWNTWHEYHSRLREAEIDVNNMNKAIAQHAQDAIEGADNLLAGIVEILEASDSHRNDYTRLHEYLRMNVSQRDSLHGLFVYDDQGRWLVNSQETLLKHANNSDREYFQFHRHSKDRGPHIGPPIQSRSTNERIITVSRRFNHADGSFAGVVLATLPVNYFKSFYLTLDIGDDGAILLASDDGTLWTRRPFSEQTGYLDITGGPVYQAYKTRGLSDTLMLTSKMDGVERLYSYQRLHEYPILVAAGLSRDEVLAPWRAETVRLVGLSAFVILLFWLFGFRLLRQIKLHELDQLALKRTKYELEHINDELASLALEDGLTGLANRRRFDAVLDVEFGRAMRNKVPLALIMIDVDSFKKFNDTYGHLAGDECLKKVAKALAAISLRPGDLAARYGGEEFALILPSTDASGAFNVASKVRGAVEALGIKHTENAYGIVTISAGVASLIPVRGQTPDALLQVADSALYMAKEKGRNRAYVFHGD
jgi:diguanylate cyclase (GGDEF)-like protein